jgi:hypothetical protein
MILVCMQDSKPVGISLPKKVISRIDSERGDVSRSRYLLRLLENVRHDIEHTEKQKILSQSSLEVGSLATQSAAVVGDSEAVECQSGGPFSNE